MNPLFSDEPSTNAAHQSDGYVLPRQAGHRIEPGGAAAGKEDYTNDANTSAVELIRRKIDALYAEEPSARQELAETRQLPTRSKHQQFMYELSAAGKSLAEIQAAWHAYYAGLSEDEKRQVWQEFYAHNYQQRVVTSEHATPAGATAIPNPLSSQMASPVIPSSSNVQRTPSAPAAGNGMIVVAEHLPAAGHYSAVNDTHNFGAIKKRVLRTVRNRNRAQLKARQHVQSLLFGLGIGAIVVLFTLFSFFNQVVIAPFIRPGHAGATPIILSTDGVAPSTDPQVIIPSINVQIPVVYGNSVNEADIQDQLEDGVIHYPSTAVPGQQGNAAFFGHSSNNIFNKGKYKFAFVLLHELQPGDIFYLTYNDKLYTYKVFDKKIVQPSDTWVLNPVAGKTATATLVTCDPPGTSLHRLVVWGEQVNPDPNANTAAPAITVQKPAELPSNSPSLWSRLWAWITP